MSTQKWDGRSERLREKNFPHLASKACRLSLEPKTGKKRKRHPGQMPRLLLEKGIRLDLTVSVRCGKVKAKNGVIWIWGARRRRLELPRATWSGPNQGIF